MKPVPSDEPMQPSAPVLGLEQAVALEASLFRGDESLEWPAMRAAGAAVAQAIVEDAAEGEGLPPGARILVLAGKGHNAGDALLAAAELLARFPALRADVLFVFGPRRLRPLAARAWRALADGHRGRVGTVRAGGLAPRYSVVIDGIFGFQYRPPLPPEAAAAIAAAASRPAGLRASVDLPSGIGEPGGFEADATYATGSLKAPLLGCAQAGRLRYLDLGFFDGRDPETPSGDRVLLRSLLDPLRGLRPAGVDKRAQGHLALIGGSGQYPGAVMMAAQAALRSGVGLLTVFVPARLAPAFAAEVPEAMWVGLPETEDGAISGVGIGRVLAGLERATALAVGPGLGRDPRTLGLIAEVLRNCRRPVLLDADALQPELVRAGRSLAIVTPHGGEFERLGGGEVRAMARKIGACVVRKGPVTAVSDGGAVFHSVFGGPVLARGGSGDLLAGLAGGLLAQAPAQPLLAACRAVVWQGVAADHLARARGQTAVRTLDLLDHLGPALRT
jgi:ADP-dependent NAD(P)H-hydrate dehydratase / NAD(P)H-hydrate epimerase